MSSGGMPNSDAIKPQLPAGGTEAVPQSPQAPIDNKVSLDIEQQALESPKQESFQIAQQLPPFLQEVVKKLDASTAFQQFRLPGSERVIVDQRDKPQQGNPEKPEQEGTKNASKKNAEEKGAHHKREAHAAGEMRMREGRLIRHRERSYENHLGDRMGHGGLDVEVAADRVERMLSAFERMVVERFEGGKIIAKESADGASKFLEKTEKQWRDFFKGFFERTVQKKALLTDIRDFLLRGVIAKGERGVFIGDMRFENGRVEKFVRFSLLAEALAKLKAMSPGDALGRGLVAEMTGEELMYLALAVSQGRELSTSMLPAHGRFMGERAEAQAAEALGITLSRHLGQKAKTLRRHGRPFGGKFFGEDGASDDIPYQFIPWWNWGNLKSSGPRKWVTAAFYGTLLILSLIGVAAATYRIINGG